MAIEESKPFVGDIEVDESYFGPMKRVSPAHSHI
jgi:hypothetical protein